MRRIQPYIHQLPTWPQFTWQPAALENLLGAVRHQQGRLLGRLDSLGLELRAEATLQTLTLDVLKSSEIEGELLPPRLSALFARLSPGLGPSRSAAG